MSELTIFKLEPSLKRTLQLFDGTAILSNPLKWWKDRAVKYPILSLIAKMLLCIPATSAPSERLFSAAGLTIANDRARLLPDNAEMLIFLQENWEAVNVFRTARGLSLL